MAAGLTFDTGALIAWERRDRRKLARSAGKALSGLARSISVVDAVVMASADQRGDVVYTSDLGDLEALRSPFPSAKVLKV